MPWHSPRQRLRLTNATIFGRNQNIAGQLQTESRSRFPEPLSPVFPHQVFDVDRERCRNQILAFGEDLIGFRENLIPILVS